MATIYNMRPPRVPYVAPPPGSASGQPAVLPMKHPRAALAFAWTGGVLFVASLAYFFLFYVDLLDRAGDAARSTVAWRGALVDLSLFGAFALHHSLLARSGVKRHVARVLPSYLERSLYVWIASLLFLLTCWWWQPVGGELYSVPRPAAWFLVACQTAGLWIIARAVANLDSLELAGIRQVLNERAGPRSRVEGGSAPPPLQEEGMYAFVRHPVYLGWLLFTFAHPHMTGSRFVFACAAAAYLVAAIPWEERSLVEAYGDRYAAYAQRVRWRMVPFVY
ncbi:MAG: hypothetical protein HYX76_13550 [Acidobacteria bacterium]|nr:hypothetical protein [Acidobacteriota bacterium]